MNTETQLRERSGGVCELCGATEDLSAHTVGPETKNDADSSVLSCSTCAGQISGAQATDTNHWRCLNDSAWSQVPAVQVIAWRMLNRLSVETWAADLLDMLYLADETMVWAKAGLADAHAAADDDAIIHKDTYGAVLVAGDTVTLIKDLKVKGASFTAKRGTAVRNISLVHDNAEHIEGRVNDQRIVILTEFVKKS
ncbi:PhnA domain-containing protein [Roseibium algae]|uniref:PhnA domain-containing protein n=1 Tax=Roseibium algae TaxID=3123038 RepID=A0ABU8TQ18_9HYPH